MRVFWSRLVVVPQTRLVKRTLAEADPQLRVRIIRLLQRAAFRASTVRYASFRTEYGQTVFVCKRGRLSAMFSRTGNTVRLYDVSSGKTEFEPTQSVSGRPCDGAAIRGPWYYATVDPEHRLGKNACDPTANKSAYVPAPLPVKAKCFTPRAVRDKWLDQTVVGIKFVCSVCSKPLRIGQGCYQSKDEPEKRAHKNCVLRSYKIGANTATKREAE